MNNATLHQRAFLTFMAAGDINYKNTINFKLTGIAKGVGIGFKDDPTDKHSNFREQMKEKQRRNKEKKISGGEIVDE